LHVAPGDSISLPLSVSRSMYPDPLPSEPVYGTRSTMSRSIFEFPFGILYFRSLGLLVFFFFDKDFVFDSLNNIRSLDLCVVLLICFVHSPLVPTLLYTRSGSQTAVATLLRRTILIYFHNLRRKGDSGGKCVSYTQSPTTIFHLPLRSRSSSSPDSPESLFIPSMAYPYERVQNIPPHNFRTLEHP
jgi:hypothetical protein